MVRYLFIHLKFRHWSLDGSTFIAQALQFSWTSQFCDGYCTVCVNTRRGSISYSVFVGKRNSSNWNSWWNSGSSWLKCDDHAACAKMVSEFSGCRMSVTDEQRSGRPPTSVDLVPAIERLCMLIAECCLKSWKNSLIFHMAQSGTLFTNV